MESYGKPFTATVQKDTSGTITVAGVTQHADVRVGSGTSVDDMKKLLPTQVEVSLSDLSSQNVAVVWNTAPYDGSMDGRYQLAGTLVMPVGLENPDGLTAEIAVIVGNSVRFDFEDGTAGQLPAGWIAGGSGITSNPDTSWAKVVQESDGNQVLAVSATTPGKDATASYRLEDPVQGEALIRYRVKYPGGSQLAPSGLADSIGFHLYWGTTTTPAVSMMTNTSQQQGHRPGTSASSTKGIYPVKLDQ